MLPTLEKDREMCVFVDSPYSIVNRMDNITYLLIFISNYYYVNNFKQMYIFIKISET